MKRMIISSANRPEHRDVILDSRILVAVDVYFPEVEISSATKQFEPFPGIDNFREHVADILENEYRFEVIKEKSNNMKRGYVTNRSETESTSVYFNTYYDLVNSVGPLQRLGRKIEEAPQAGEVYCFIHIRFSDHMLNDLGYKDRIKWIRDNAEEHTKGRSDVNQVWEDEEIILNEVDLHQYYSAAIEDLRDQLDYKIGYWVKAAERRNSYT